MVIRLRRHNALLGILSALIFAAPSSALAHRLDELLIATRIDIASDIITLEIDLQPGVAVLAEFMSWIDANENAQISPSEATTFAQSLIRSTSLHLDDARLEIGLSSVTTPSIESLEQGQGRLQIVATAQFAPSVGSRGLRYINAFRPGISVYLVNAYLPQDPSITLGKQKRDKLQRVYEVPFTQHAPETSPDDNPSQCYRSGASLLKTFIQWSRSARKALNAHSR